MATKMENSKLEALLAVARGQKKAKLVLKHCKIVDVYNCAVIEGDIAIEDDLIAGIGDGYEGEEEIDIEGRYALPGFMLGSSNLSIWRRCKNA